MNTKVGYIMSPSSRTITRTLNWLTAQSKLLLIKKGTHYSKIRTSYCDPDIEIIWTMLNDFKCSH